MPLATVAQVQQFLGIPAGQDDALLQTMIDGASAFVYGIVGRSSFDIISATESYNGTGSGTLVPDRRPLTNVASLKIDGVTIPASSDVFTAGFVFNQYGVHLRTYKFCEGVMNIEVTYSAGFAAVPSDVTQTVIEMVASKYQRRKTIGISSKTIGQETISYTNADLSNEHKNILQHYKSVFLTA